LAKLFRGAKIGISHKGTKGEGIIGGKLKSGGILSIIKSQYNVIFCEKDKSK
jgi:hypothetical protein